MNRWTRPLAFICLGACTSYASAVPPGQFRIGSTYQVDLRQSWSKLEAGAPKSLSAVVLSIDGLPLDGLYFVEALEPSKSIVKTSDAIKTAPVYRQDMSAREIAEFFGDSLAAVGYRNVEIRGVRPHPFGSSEGVRFDLVAVYGTGLNIQGTGLAAKVDGKLNALLFLAPEEYYFSRYRPDIELIFQSVRMVRG